MHLEVNPYRSEHLCFLRGVQEEDAQDDEQGATLATLKCPASFETASELQKHIM